MKFKIYFCIFVIISINLSKSQECGQQKHGSSLIAGGEYSWRGQWPWLAPLFYSLDDRFFCGSTIISKKHLLSASHCFIDKGSSSILSPNLVYTLLGKFDLDNLNEHGVTKAYIESITIHPDWKPLAETYDGDIAIIKLKSDMIFTNFIQPACLPTTTTEVFEVDGFVAGYGLSGSEVSTHEKKPKYVKIETVTQETCLFSHYTISIISSMRMFCAGKVGRNPCKGDSGGGFVVKNGNKYEVIGIVSSSITQNCGENRYVLFTNVPKFVAWIKHEIGALEVDEWKTTPLKCTFAYYVHDNSRYQCHNEGNFESTSPYIKISHLEGTFTDGKTFSDVNTVHITGGKVTYIPDLTAARNKLPNFEKLFITFSGLKYVEKSKLAKLTQLKFLNFYGNDIENLDPDVFDDLVNLEHLLFVNNKIKVLPSRLLWNLPNLKSFWAYENPIAEIPIRFFKNNKKIEEIWLGPSKIRKIGVNFKSLLNLKLLDLRKNICINEILCSTCGVTIEAMQEKIDESC